MEKFDAPVPERQGEMGRSPKEHYEHLLSELKELDDAKYASMPQDLVASMKETKLKIIEAFKAEHPELNN